MYEKWAFIVDTLFVNEIDYTETLLTFYVIYPGGISNHVEERRGGGGIERI